MENDEVLLARAESALTEIKVAQGLSEEHASVLAALRIRLKGKADATLEELLESAGDLGGPSGRELGGDAPPRRKRSLDEAIAQPEPRRSLDDAMAQPERKRSLDDVLGQADDPRPNGA